jgi:hypothetical protein
MLKIKLSIPGARENINISQFVGNSKNEHNGCIFYVNNNIEDPDFWFIIEEPHENDKICNIDKSRVILLTAEVAHQPGYYDSKKAILYLNQFGEIYTCYEIYRDNVTSDLPFLPWMINANHGDSIYAQNPRDISYFENMVNIEKSKTLSVICSNVTWTEFHLKRFLFVKELKKHFKDKLDWYGNGINPIKTKWEGIAPYKYHIVLENQVKYNVITEKLYDSFLGQSYPIYSGACNVFEHFPKNSLIEISINDLKRTINSIEKVIEENYFSNYSNEILVAKNITIHNKNLFTRIATIAKEKHNILPNNSNQIQISPMNYTNHFAKSKYLLNFTGRAFRKIGNQLIKLSQ